jgi:hypothetical protein
MAVKTPAADSNRRPRLFLLVARQQGLARLALEHFQIMSHVELTSVGAGTGGGAHGRPVP